MKIDIEKIKRNKNLSILESYLENLTYSNINENEINSVHVKYVVKLIKVLQFVIEILLDCQNKLENDLQILQEENYKLIYENKSKENIILKNKDIIGNLKKQNQNNIGIILTFKNIVNNLRTNNQKLELNNKNEEEIFCQYCINVKFKNQNDLERHLLKTHQINLEIKNEKKKNFEKTLNELKNQFDEYIKNYQNGINLMEPPNKSENEVYEKIESDFKNILNDLKNLIFNKNIPQNYILKEVEKKNDVQEITILQNQLNKMNITLQKMNENNQKVIKDLRKSYDEKINKLIQDNEKKLNENNIRNITHNKEININQNNKNNISIKNPIINSKIDNNNNEELNFKNKKNNLLNNNINQKENIKINLDNIKINEKLIDIENKSENKIKESKEEEEIEIELKSKKIELESYIDKDNENIEFKNKENEKEKLKMKNKIIEDYKSLEDFYLRYRERDQNIFKEANKDNYEENILPKNFQEDNNLIENFIKDNFSFFTNKFNTTKNYNYDNIDNIENEKLEDLIDLTDTIFNNIKTLNTKDIIINKYYNSINKYLNLELIENEKSKIYKNEFIIKRDKGILSQNHDYIISDVNRISLSKIEDINDLKIDESKKEELKEDEFEVEEKEEKVKVEEEEEDKIS